MAKNKPLLLPELIMPFVVSDRLLAISWEMNTSHNVPHGLGDLVGIPVRRLEDDELAGWC